MKEINSSDVSRAIFKGDIESLNAFLKAGLDVEHITEKEKWNCLHIATQSVSLPIQISSLNFFLENKVNVNSKDIYGNTPLHYAARNKNAEAIKLLLAANAEIDVKNNEDITPLHQTLLTKPYTKPYNLEATEALLKANANPNQINDYIITISHGEDYVIKELFEKYQA